MSLSTFGAVMGFAAELVGQTENAYKALVEKAKNPVLRETFRSLLKDASKNYSRMEQIRREHVTEMILEPVAGLHRQDYQMDFNITDLAEDVDLLKAALNLEERTRKFFQEASSKIPLPEVARIFQKMAQKKEKEIDSLRSSLKFFS